MLAKFIKGFVWERNSCYGPGSLKAACKTAGKRCHQASCVHGGNGRRQRTELEVCVCFTEAQVSYGRTYMYVSSRMLGPGLQPWGGGSPPNPCGAGGSSGKAG